MIPPPQLQKFERSPWENVKYGKNPFRTVSAVERTWEDVPYYGSFIANSWLNDLKDTGQGQKSSHATHTLILVINDRFVKYWKNPSTIVSAVEHDKMSHI